VKCVEGTGRVPRYSKGETMNKCCIKKFQGCCCVCRSHYPLVNKSEKNTQGYVCLAPLDLDSINVYTANRHGICELFGLKKIGGIS